MNEDLDITDDLGNVEFESFEDNSDFSELKNLSSSELCNLVIAFRYLGVFRDRSIASMRELSSRRVDGDPFDFEQYISVEMKKLPSLDLNIQTNSFSLPFQMLNKK